MAAAAGVAVRVDAQFLPDPAAGTEAGSATPYTEQTVGDVDPLARSLRFIDPAQAADVMRDRVLRARAVDPLAPGDGGGVSGRGFLYRAPGVRARFARPVYRTWTAYGETLNGTPARQGDFEEVIPPDTVFDLTLPPRPTAELTPFSAGMVAEHRLPLAQPAPPMDRRIVAPALGVGARPPGERSLPPRSPDPEAAAQPRRLQPWVRVERDAEGRLRVVEADAPEARPPASEP
ncbi:hypothetical protein PSMK_31990 [Phycisphaera mikurensis NBRC 102666]|uniref:Uncharacterized protein n=1 Tax=Phycisphaera mikurensis (strain NBRC 102666 / KCTC 22515 / FYK2301M01) TaxID=1142394 RepID=I0IJC0_PHYMF|nr:hypothetical protein PSMK_31990 [Phycisphaera mikurensis NBRC 102666]